jgi:farnesyl diphosphate synthase
MNIKHFETYLKDNLPKSDSFHPNYENALKKMLFCGGKRFRPMLLLSIVDFYEPLLNSSSMDIALAIEYLHTYSLIHDDLPAMDNATLRRGEATLHTTYDEALAILVGDALNTEAFYKISKSTLRDDVKIKLIEILSYNGGLNGMVLGQAIDLHFEDTRLSYNRLCMLHINKTAKLIAGALQMGAVIVNLSNKQQNDLYDMGLELGLLFQIQDDILDVVSCKELLGKDVNQDKDKNSFVSLLGIDKSIEEADKKVSKVLSILDKFDKDFSIYMIENLNPYLYRHKK